MPKRIGKVEYKTITDLAYTLGISVSTTRRYIKKGVLPPPERKYFASQSVAIFSDAYIQNATKVVQRLQNGEAQAPLGGSPP
jgi:hypothetical protein